MNTRHRLYKIDVPIYETQLHVLICPKCNLEEVSKKYYKCQLVNDDSDVNYCLFYGIKTKQGSTVFVLYGKKYPKTKKDIAIYSHELFHATFRIMDYHYVKFDIQNQEPFAYLYEYLFYNFIKRIKTKVS